MEESVDLPAEPLKNHNEPASDHILVESENFKDVNNSKSSSSFNQEKE